MASERSRFDPSPNALARAIAELRDKNRPISDLTISNPTAAGLPYDTAAILRALSDARALRYEPLPFGLAAAREAAAKEISRARPVDAEHVFLTASSSEAYSFLFKLLCDPGDAVAIAAPSYPLFEHLAKLENVSVSPYRLAYDGAWHVDVDSLRRAIGPKTRAIVIVHPNNPTGSFVSKAELATMASFGLPIVSDEVFIDYAFTGDPMRAKTAREADGVLVFALGGLSKSAALPQMKLGWTAVSGPDALVSDALERLELIADTFLSVGTPVQHALAPLLDAGASTRAAIFDRANKNISAIDRVLGKNSSLTRLRVDGGWYATLRLPAVKSEEEWVLELVREDGVLVHPGAFFDFESEAYVVVSLLTPERDLEDGMKKIARRIEIA